MKYFFMIFALLYITPVLAEISCPPEKPLVERGRCYACDEKMPIEDEQCSEKCPNRTWHEYEGCLLGECLPHAPMKTKHGCVPCDIDKELTRMFDDINAWECAQCPNRHFYNSASKKDICALSRSSDKAIK